MSHSSLIWRRLALAVVVAVVAACPASAETVAYSWSAEYWGGDEVLYEIILETGQATPIHWVDARDMEAGAVLPDGRIVGLDSSNQEYWQLLPTPELVGTPDTVGVDVGMHYDPITGWLYALTGGTWEIFESSYLYLIDAETGAAMMIGYDLDHYADSLAISASGQAYAVDDTFQQRLYLVDLGTGQLTPGPDIRTTTGGTILGGGGLAFGPDGTLWMTQGHKGRIYKLNPTTGVATYVSTISAHEPGFRWDFLAIPLDEPSAPGDLNCDGLVDFFDVDPFILAVTDPAGYDAAYPDCDRLLADINEDGLVDFFDIDGFVALVTGGW